MSKQCKNVGEEKVASGDILDNVIENSIFYDRFENLLVDFNKNIVASNVVPVDREILSKNARALNLFVKSSFDVIGKEPFVANYPNLFERIDVGGVLTQIETLEYINEYLYDFVTFPTFVSNPGNTVTLTTLETFYSPNNISRSSMGSFCDLIQSIFGSVVGVFELFKDVSEFASKLPELIGKIGNFNAASLLKTLKDKILKTIDKLVGNSLGKLKNFGLGFMDKSSPYNSTPIYQKIDSNKSHIGKFFSKTNIETIKKRIEGLIGFSVSLFEKPDIEEIQFLIYRFCKLIGEVEKLFSGVFAPLYSIQNNYEETRTILKASSGYNSAYASSAGAVRYTEEQRIAGISKGNEIVAENVPIDSSGNPPSGEEVAGVPSWDIIRNSVNGDSRIVLAPNNSGDVYVARGSNRNMSRASWDKSTVTAKVTLLRFQKNLSAALGRNVKFYINSAYRSHDYNTGVGGASASLHMSGGAFDISTSASLGISTADRATFIRIARESGFKGIGKYSGFIHVDIGRERSWGSF